MPSHRWLLASPVVSLVVAACSPAAYAPPSRGFALDSPITPAAGHQDVQGDLGRVGAPVFGPDLVAGQARLRRAITPEVTVEGEAGVLEVTNGGSTSTPREGYTGRAGVQLGRELDDAIRGAVTAGVGGGYARAAGGWTALDLGVAVAGEGRHVRPFLGAEVSFDRALSGRTFTITDGDARTTLRLANNATLRGTLGIEFGRPEAAVLLGVSLARIFAHDNGVVSGSSSTDDSDLFLALGAGVRIAL